MIRRARLLSVVTMLVAGVTGVISSTQTWFTVTLTDGAHHELTVSGASAIPVLAPLSLAVLALGAALSIVGTVLRYVFGALAIALGVVLMLLTVPAMTDPGTRHVASTVTGATGIAGEDAVSALLQAIDASVWPTVTLVAWVVLLVGGVLVLATAHRWRGSDRRYRAQSEAPAAAGATASRPHDAIDDWDDLSRGDDPTDRPLD